MWWNEKEEWKRNFWFRGKEMIRKDWREKKNVKILKKMEDKTKMKDGKWNRREMRELEHERWRGWPVIDK